MLAKFIVRNFKSFEKDFVVDFTQSHAYQFNSESIKNDIVKNAIVYGYNGTGKSNLGMAIFDIIQHLTDFEKNESFYKNYINAFNPSKYAEFEYEFVFDRDKVRYEYKKTNRSTVVFERLTINGKPVAYINREVDNLAEIKLDGTQTLNKNIANENLSLIKYIRNNSVLAINEENTAFLSFLHFVDGMLFFRSLNANMYMGLESGRRNIEEDIIERGNVEQLQQFLNKAKIEAKLSVIESPLNSPMLALDFDGVKIPFYEAASTGTRALTLFYFWLQRVRQHKVSFIFIDEYDAFYHHSLAISIVEELKKSGVQFILTTHNTSVISNEILRPDCYFIMNKKEMRSLAKSTTKELREAHNIEKMYKAGTFND